MGITVELDQPFSYKHSDSCRYFATDSHRLLRTRAPGEIPVTVPKTRDSADFGACASAIPCKYRTAGRFVVWLADIRFPKNDERLVLGKSSEQSRREDWVQFLFAFRGGVVYIVPFDMNIRVTSNIFQLLGGCNLLEVVCDRNHHPP